MIKAPLIVAATLLATPALAQNYDCQTRGYCTNALECSPDDERFTIRAQPDGTSAFGWVGSATFSAKPIRRDAFTVWMNTSNSESIQMLSLSNNGVDATFAVMLDIGGFYHSMQALTCARVPG